MHSEFTQKLHTGRSMPTLGLGTWQLSKDTADIVVKALELGYRMIDTSGDYGTQPGIAKGLKKSDVDRSSIYIVTKVEEDEDAYKSAQKNVSELGLEYADLILIHRPPKGSAGQKLWEGLRRARDDGIVKDIGVSNYTIEQMQTLAESSSEMPTVNQIEWTPFGHSQDMLDFCQENDIIIQAYSPLTRTKRLDDKLVARLAKKYGKTPAQILIRWCLQIGCVPLPKANKRKHLEDNADVFDFEINQNDMAGLNKLNEHYSALGGLPYV